MALPSEVATLMKALDSLQTATTPTNLASCSRTVARAADDLELVCEETADPSLCKQLTSYIERAREAVSTARKNARAAALKADRNALIEPPSLEPAESQGTAGRLAAEINDALRATAAVVSEEIQRSKVAGDVVEESTRRLRMTTDQHGVYADGIVSGASTLKSIRTTDLVANFVLVLCFALFFVAATYVANRRVQSSNVNTFIVRPAYKMASLPVRITSWVLRSAFAKLGSGSTQTQRPSSSDLQNNKHRTETEPREPRGIEDREFSDDAGGRSLGDSDTHNERPLEEAQETPHVSPSQDLDEGTQNDVAQHAGEFTSVAEENAVNDWTREDPETATVMGDSGGTEQNIVDDKIKADSETVRILGHDDGIASGDPNNLPKAVRDEQSEALRKPSPSSQYETHFGAESTTHSEQVVREMPSTEPKGSRLSEDSRDLRGLDQQRFFAIDEENVVDTVQDGGRILPAEKDLESLLYPLLSDHKSVPQEDAEREVSPKPLEHMELTPEKGMDDETYRERNRNVSSDSKDDGESARPELQEVGDEQESEVLLTIPLPSQDESPDADDITNEKDNSETVEQNEPKTTMDKGSESPQSDMISSRESKQQNVPSVAEGKGGESSQADDVTEGKETRETAVQEELQVAKDKDDGESARETPALSGGAERVKQSEQHEIRESSREIEHEILTDVSFPSLYTASESKDDTVDMTLTGVVGQINQEVREEKEHRKQYPSPTFTVVEGGKDMQLEVVSEKIVQHDLSTICLVPGVDSHLLQICAVSTWIYR